jgi:hypothetical protein
VKGGDNKQMLKKSPALQNSITISAAEYEVRSLLNSSILIRCKMTGLRLSQMKMVAIILVLLLLFLTTSCTNVSTQNSNEYSQPTTSLNLLPNNESLSKEIDEVAPVTNKASNRINVEITMSWEIAYAILKMSYSELSNTYSLQEAQYDDFCVCGEHYYDHKWFYLGSNNSNCFNYELLVHLSKETLETIVYDRLMGMIAPSTMLFGQDVVTYDVLYSYFEEKEESEKELDPKLQLTSNIDGTYTLCYFSNTMSYYAIFISEPSENTLVGSISMFVHYDP